MLSHINAGTGADNSILELARLVTDPSKPDGNPCKRLDVTCIASIGWQARIGLREGIDATY